MIRKFEDCAVAGVGVLEQTARSFHREQMALVREARVEVVQVTARRPIAELRRHTR